MSSFAEILRALWAMRPAHSFWQIWITITAAAAICVAVAVGRPAAPRRQGATKRPINLIRTWREVETPGAVAALTLLAVIVAFYIAMTLVWEDFSFSDNPWFTLFTLKGDNVGKPIWPASGRFFPLGFQEFNLVRHFTDTITGYQVLPIVQLLIFSCILLVLDDDLSITARAALVILALLTPSILISFTGLIFPERNVLFFLSCLLLSVKRFGQTQSIAWAVAAVVCAQFMLYYKETAFLLLLGFAAGRLVWRCRSAPHGGWDYDRLWDKESRLDLCLASLAVLFLLYYSAGMGLYHYFGYKSEVYAAAARQPLAEIVTGYIRVDLLAWLFVAIVLGRIYLILRQRAAPSLLWDPLAFGGVACLIGYLYLGLFHVYYLAPVDLIAVLYVGRFAALSWTRMRSWAKIAASVLAFTLLLQYVVVSAFALFQQKILFVQTGK